MATINSYTSTSSKVVSVVSYNFRSLGNKNPRVTSAELRHIVHIFIRGRGRRGFCGLLNLVVRLAGDLKSIE